MWDLFNRRKVRELKSKIFDLEHALFEEKAFGEIGAKKVKHWVEKHDALLIKYKELLNKYEPKAKNNDQDVKNSED